MTRTKLLALLICVFAAPAFGQTETKRNFTIRNETGIVIQLQLESPNGPANDRTQQLLPGQDQRLAIHRGWSARVDFIDSSHRPQWLHVVNNSHFIAKMQNGSPTITRKILSDQQLDREEAQAILRIIKRSPLIRIKVRNDSSVGMWVKPNGSADKRDAHWIAAGKSRKIFLEPNVKLKAHFQNGKQISIDQPKDATVYRFFQSSVGFLVDTEAMDMQALNTKIGNELERALGISIKVIGDRLWKITQIDNNSIARRLRFQTGDTITECCGAPVLDSSGSPKLGMQLKAVRVVTTDGVVMLSELPRDLEKVWLEN